MKQTYTLGQTYRLCPFGMRKTYDCEFVGNIEIGGCWDKDRIEKLPTFKVDMSSGGDKGFDPRYVALRKGRLFAQGSRLSQMDGLHCLLDNIHQQIRYVGNQWEEIEIPGCAKLTRTEFVRQTEAAQMSRADIDNAVSRGGFSSARIEGEEIKWCPTCKVIRRTTCSACGCGGCKTCGYRWSCRSGDLGFGPLNISPS